MNNQEKQPLLEQISTEQLETELLKRHRRDQPGNINDFRDVVALRDQLLSETMKGVEYNEKEGTMRMKRKNLDTLIRDWENTTNNWKNDWKMEIARNKKKKNNDE